GGGPNLGAWLAGGGGGATDVRTGPGFGLGDRVLVAGAGGGGGATWSSTGGAGGDSGAAGHRADPQDFADWQGGGGGAPGQQHGGGAGGAGGTGNVADGADGFPGTAGQGGAIAPSTASGEGGGGGGGWFGGGSGGAGGVSNEPSAGGGGGGGGSSHVAPTAALVSLTEGVNAGHGRVVISYQAPRAVVTGVQPGSVSTLGGEVTVTGENLGDVSAVLFGDVPAPWFVVESHDRLRAAAPAHAAGPVHLGVVTPEGVSEPTAASVVTFVAPLAPIVPIPPVGLPPSDDTESESRCVVPDLEDRTARRARRALRRAGCRLGDVERPRRGHGHDRRPLRVVRQTPAAGDERPWRAEVDIVLGRSRD
ncbi:MAG TPA: IPT/TIG domain-containing protein, partial [Naasia sp.]